MLKRFATAATAAIFVATPVHAASMRDIFDSINAYGNTSAPGAFQGQTMNLYTGGSLFLRMPRKTYNLASVSAPSWSAGCGGIDLFAGAFSFINKEQFVALLRNIGSNALGYAFKLAIQNLCPTCDNVMQALEQTARAMNNLNVNSCEMAEGLVNAALPDTVRKSEANLAKTTGAFTNQFTDALDSWAKVFGSQTQARSTITQAVAAAPEIKNKDPQGNVAWRALTSLSGLDNATRELYMSLIGTVIFKDDAEPRYIPGREITLEILVGKPDEDNVSIPVWRCTDGHNVDQCLNVAESTDASQKSLLTFVREKMQLITNNIADRAEYGGTRADIIQFINVTDIPVYKMLAVTSSLNNTALAESMIYRYQELIAAKYAEVYIQSAIREIRAALDRQAALGDASQSDAIREMRTRLSELASQTRQALANAYTQTSSTYQIAQEVSSWERSLNASMPFALRNSLNFQRGLGG
jgi:conjugative transfer pilus assembly protein TraH